MPDERFSFATALNALKVLHDDEAPAAPIIHVRPAPTATPAEALAFSVVAFVSALAGHLGRTFEDADQLLGGTAFNLWPMVDSPQGWTAMALLLSPPDRGGPLLTPTIH